MQRRDHVGMAVAEAGDGRAAGGVDVTLARGVEDLDAPTADGDGQIGVGDAMEDMTHGCGVSERGSVIVARKPRRGDELPASRNGNACLQ